MRVKLAASTLILTLLVMGVPCEAFVPGLMPGMTSADDCCADGGMAAGCVAPAEVMACCLDTPNTPSPDRARDSVRSPDASGPELLQTPGVVQLTRAGTPAPRGPRPPDTTRRHVLLSVFLI